ncbi:MAG: M3 family oligoendopeptidase [Polyangiaceae bacterium]|nr:M3 family oligoendopeptidase [Polyangiaceae bacterium]
MSEEGLGEPRPESYGESVPSAPRPDWDLTPFFQGLGAPDYVEFQAALARDLPALAVRVAALPPLTPDGFSVWSALLADLEGFWARLRHLSSYLGCVSAADARDDAARRDVAALARTRAAFDKAMVDLRTRLGACTSGDFSAFVARAEIAAIAYPLARLRQLSARSMAPELEALATDLNVDGIAAWGRLYDQLSGSLEFALEVPGRPPERHPVSVVRSLLGDPDPAVRRAALLGGNRAWEGIADSVVAALNAIAGTRLTLYPRRNISDFLDPPRFDAAIGRATLDAMMTAVRARAAVPRRFLVLKARALGRERLGFQDLEAPLPTSDDDPLTWEAATTRVLAAFARYPALQRFASGAIARLWIDHQPRDGKRPGGFCTSSPLIGQSRIFLTFGGVLGDMQTLAHELGHAFHSAVMTDLRPWQQNYPMTLAETASTFAEQLVTDAVLDDPTATRARRLAVLDQRLIDGVGFLLNIPMRFDFECAFYEERQRGEISVARACELMVSAQRQHFGDALDPDELDPWFWASKLHFYIVGTSFYNFPYTFGFLVSRGLAARAVAARSGAERASFFAGYERFLAESGSAPAEAVARATLGVDLGDSGFWHECIDLIERDLAVFEALVAE